MTYAIGGFLYEKKIFKIMHSIGLLPEDVKKTAGASSVDPDIVIQIKGQKINVEIKQDINAQSGGTSIKYKKGNDFVLVKDLDCLSNEELNKHLSGHINSIDNLLSFFNKESIPFSTTKLKWNEAVEKDLIKKASTRIINSINFIEEHYTKKNVNYIHFGKHGLFYMKEDKIKLGVPRLNGDVILEVRPTRNGSKLNASGVRVCSGSLRIQARIKNVKKSHASLEDGVEFLKFIESLP